MSDERCIALYTSKYPVILFIQPCETCQESTSFRESCHGGRDAPLPVFRASGTRRLLRLHPTIGWAISTRVSGCFGPSWLFASLPRDVASIPNSLGRVATKRPILKLKSVIWFLPFLKYLPCLNTRYTRDTPGHNTMSLYYNTRNSPTFYVMCGLSRNDYTLFCIVCTVHSIISYSQTN